MSHTVRIYHNRLKTSPLALTIELGPDDHAAFTPGEDEAGAAFLMDLVGNGAAIPMDPFVIGPDAGAAYLDAVASMLGRTSRWLVVVD